MQFLAFEFAVYAVRKVEEGRRRAGLEETGEGMGKRRGVVSKVSLGLTVGGRIEESASRVTVARPTIISARPW
eukprot:2083890-Rhodomonas_salina.1